MVNSPRKHRMPTMVDHLHLSPLNDERVLFIVQYTGRVLVRIHYALQTV